MTFCFWKIQTSEKDYLETETITKSRPKIETLIVARNKAKRLKQSLLRLCYSGRALVTLDYLFQSSDLG